jgi:hypothetical protein
VNRAAPSGAKTLLFYHAGDGINIICAVRTAKAPVSILGSGAWYLAVLKMRQPARAWLNQQTGTGTSPKPALAEFVATTRPLTAPPRG